jgi:hypothetical protein
VLYSANRDEALNEWTWNLNPVDDILRHFERPDSRLRLEKEIASLCLEITAGERSIESIERIHRTLMQTDTTLFSIQSAFDLKDICHSDTSGRSELLKWYLGQVATFSQLIEQLLQAIEPQSTRLPIHIRRWVNSLSTIELCPQLQAHHTAIATDYETHIAGAYHALARRAVIDPHLDAYAKRLSDNNLDEKQGLFTSVHQDESMAYFERLAVAFGKARPLLSDIRKFESEQFTNFSYSIADALTLLRKSFAGCHPECATEIDRLVAGGRLRLLPSDNQPDLCQDTPFGSYVQVFFDGTLSSVVRLAHEIGHAVHQHLHRASSKSSIPLNAIDSETWALDFETTFLNYLVTQQHCRSCAIQAYQQSRRIEMNHRHRMLSRFERALHNRDIRSIDDIDALWLATNRLFYGKHVSFDQGFERSWTQVHHLFTAPFYLMIYGIAQERADANRPTLSINQHYPQRTE